MQATSEAEECRTSAHLGTDATLTQFCSARSQVWGCLNGGAKLSQVSGIGVRVDGNSSAPSGATLANKGEISRASNRSKVGKWAYQRARQRAAKAGGTVYKGRIIYSTGQSVRVPESRKGLGSEARRGIFCWNAGGISSELYAELLRYLETTATIDIAITQETHWSTTGEWTAGQWQFIHTASERSRQDGVLVAVRKSLLTNQEVCWQEIVPGRLLRVRVELCHQSCEILGLYQHAMTARSATEKSKVLSRRKAVWGAFEKALSGLPFRAMLVLGGDFNASLETRASVAGSGLVQGSQASDLVQERQMVMEILTKHRLAVLNSWGKKSPTYMRPSGNSQIDFLCIRQRSADKVSRQTGPRQVGLAAWRSAGHLPLLGSLLASWRPWKGGKGIPRPKGQGQVSGGGPVQQLRNEFCLIALERKPVTGFASEVSGPAD